MFAFHHCALSVRDLDESIAFYGCFGFRPAFVWHAPDASVSIAHLVLKDHDAVLELFCYAANSTSPREEQSVGNDLACIGVKHLALKVSSLPEAKRLLSEYGLPEGTAITHGRIGIDYFFVQDPDGLWLEIVEDNRELTIS